MSDTRTVLISGGRRGIGAVTAQLLLAQGWRVSLGLRGGLRPEWAADIPEDRLHCTDHKATDPEGEAAWVASALAAFGRVDAVIASAGISTGKGLLAVSDDEIRQMMEINILAPRRLALAAWQALSASGRGRIVLIGSLSGTRVKSAASGSYALSKFAAVALNHSLRQRALPSAFTRPSSAPVLWRRIWPKA